jgi:hypothetical protein
MPVEPTTVTTTSTDGLTGLSIESAGRATSEDDDDDGGASTAMIATAVVAVVLAGLGTVVGWRRRWGRPGI